jgi:hypothetical protein
MTARYEPDSLFCSGKLFEANHAMASFANGQALYSVLDSPSRKEGFAKS